MPTAKSATNEVLRPTRSILRRLLSTNSWADFPARISLSLRSEQQPPRQDGWQTLRPWGRPGVRLHFKCCNLKWVHVNEIVICACAEVPLFTVVEWKDFQLQRCRLYVSLVYNHALAAGDKFSFNSRWNVFATGKLSVASIAPLCVIFFSFFFACSSMCGHSDNHNPKIEGMTKTQSSVDIPPEVSSNMLKTRQIVVWCILSRVLALNCVRFITSACWPGCLQSVLFYLFRHHITSHSFLCSLLFSASEVTGMLTPKKE